MSPRIARSIKNPYLLVSLALLLWLTFFDRYNFFRRYRDYQELKSNERNRDYYQSMADSALFKLDGIYKDKESLERFAREKYRMKKDNEELYILESTPDKQPVEE